MVNMSIVTPAEAGSGQSRFGVPRLRGSQYGEGTPNAIDRVWEPTPNENSGGTRAHVYTYNDSGNMVYDGTYTYGYDPENRLVGVHKSGSYGTLTLGDAMDSPLTYTDDVGWTGSLPALPPPEPAATNWRYLEYTYDASGRRIEKKYDYETVTKYVYDGDQCIAEYNAYNQLKRKYIYGPGVDQPICLIDSMTSPAVTAYYHFDALGSVVTLTNSSGNTVEVYEYDVYGRVGATDANHPNRILFTGREYDKETGLYYYRARYYNPQIGRFLQTDPLGYGPGMNLYRYCSNNPMLLLDPLGCDPTDNKPGIISLCAITEGTFYNSWGMRITPNSSYKWQTGMNFLDNLVSATAKYGEITTLNIFSHGWLVNSDPGYQHRGGVWGQRDVGYENSGFYGQSKSYDHPESRDLDDLETLINEGKVKFAKGGTIFMNACHAANTGYFARELALTTGCTVYAATGKVTEYRVGDDWVQWRTFAEGGEEGAITWKKFLPDGTEVDLGVTILQISEGDTSPTIPAQRTAPAK